MEGHSVASGIVRFYEEAELFLEEQGWEEKETGLYHLCKKAW